MTASTTDVPRTLRRSEVSVGDQLPPLQLPITRTLIVATAIASRDYQDVHHDPELAAQRGSRDIFMNILTTNGLVGRFVSGWAGPASVLRALRIRLGVPNYPGDVMTLTGEVLEVGDAGDVVVRIRGANGTGDHVTGTATVRLPEGGR